MRALVVLTFLVMSFLTYGQNASMDSNFFDVEYSESTGRVFMNITEFDQEFIYVNYIAGGLGSNDIGLDRGKIADSRLVKFVKYGGKVLLVQPNLDYRAISTNMKEVEAIEQAFAQSILWGFNIISNKGSNTQIDLTPFLLQDANNIVTTLKDKKQGTFKFNPTRSAIKEESLLQFPQNVEFESILTFVGDAEGSYLKSVTPTNEAVSLVQHQSFVALPPEGYRPRVYHPYSGFFDLSFKDYAVPIESSLDKKYIMRHRLEKKDPTSSISEPIEPIIYYVDSGCPEPIKSALIEGASWWNQAFESAGFKNAFIVKELPDDAHPLDVRYNVIQWVHRSTRGWSYGASISDPRTGEIIKGHVSLGSLRVRQDFMIAQGILSPYEDDSNNHAPMLDLALARLRQLSAHEVGHTIGLAHNFAASINDRASVMDYPHPFIQLRAGSIDLTKAYDDKIGAWDKRAIVYGYAQIEEHEENVKLQNILKETQSMDLLFLSDPDARPAGSASPYAHLWDNGSDPVAELNRILELRKFSLDQFGVNTIPDGTPYSELEKVLVPTYLMHRYQAEAVSKIVGGVDYSYGVKGFNSLSNNVINVDRQMEALDALLATIKYKSLEFPVHVVEKIQPYAYGYGRSRESFGSKSGLVFDPMAGPEAYSNFVIGLLLNEQRLSRIRRQGLITLNQYMQHVVDAVFNIEKPSTDYSQSVAMNVQKVLIVHLLRLSKNGVDLQVAATANRTLGQFTPKNKYVTKDIEWATHYRYLNKMINNSNRDFKLTNLPTLSVMPPGSPIGCH